MPGTQMQLNIVHASAGTGSIDVLQNLKTVGTFNYLNALNIPANYVSVDSGFNNYRLQLGTVQLANLLFSNTKGRYSFFLFDTATTDKLKYFFVEDNLDTTGLGKQSKIRLLHLSPDVDSLEVLTNRPANILQDSVVIAAKPYAGKLTQANLLSSGAFQSFYADTTVTIKIRSIANAGITRQYQLQFSKGAVYSLVMKGYLGKTNADSLSLSIIKHN
ncbi:DUF4397 domain-containing protein [Lacibacter sediminis]|uniref:DUF4397 domain-containing protein n=1 Tax=Lacibacter sediminis TaxID=2760713 RepID=A0A7G5XBJ3_9BACT|nr:DUF4397 domain-containing protein [Lacibacter sediminis]QNA42846.1 DUF4397 domain-containing protein [Lacibacter sediminis]